MPDQAALATGASSDVLRFARPTSLARDDLDPWLRIGQGRYRLSANVNFEVIAPGAFKLGQVKENWDRALRYELDFLGHVPVGDHLEAFGGGYFFWENRDWDEGPTSVSCDTLGVGLESGIFLWLREKGSAEDFNVALVPYGRLGFGWQNGSFHDLPTPLGISAGDLGGSRFELTIGADARFFLAKHVMLGGGAGFSYWDSVTQWGTTRDAAGNFLDDEDLAFRGTDVFYRVSLGFLF